MTNENSAQSDRACLREQAMARWDNDGGAESAPVSVGQAAAAVPELSNAELVQLRVRVIALENLIISLLADGSERQLEHVREMAAFITPRPGQTQHPLTLDAASHMLGLVHRAGHFRAGDGHSQ